MFLWEPSLKRKRCILYSVLDCMKISDCTLCTLLHLVSINNSFKRNRYVGTICLRISFSNLSCLLRVLCKEEKSSRIKLVQKLKKHLKTIFCNQQLPALKMLSYSFQNKLCKFYLFSEWRLHWDSIATVDCLGSLEVTSWLLCHS